MEITTLSFTVSLIGAALALLTVIMASFRRERGLSIYAAAFVCSVAGFLLFMFQGAVPLWLGIVFANLLIISFQFGLAWGLRTCLGIDRPWPLRFWSYLAAYFALFMVGTYVLNSYTTRAVVFSSFIILGASEFLFALRRGSYPIPAVIRRSSTAVVLVFILAHFLRIGFLLIWMDPGTRLMENYFVNVYTFVFTAFFSVLWAGVILIIDAAGLFAELDRKNDILRDLAATDELTGLANRHAFEGKIQAEIERSIRYREPLSLIMFDIDHFKRVNDTWGHQVGDEVLKRLAAVTGAIIREPDTLFRWGGEEFVILAPHTKLSGANPMAEKLRKAIEKSSFPVVGSITASFGVAEWQESLSRDEWFKKVDQAMYRAKNSGRNKVVSFGRQDDFPIALVRLEWRSEWDSGDSTIDEEHRRLLEMSNNLLDLSLSQASAKEIKSQLDDLLKHIADHFSDEESILSRIGYPDQADHVRMHRSLLAEASILKTFAETGDCVPGVFFDYLVGKVLIGHMLQADVKFFPFTRKAV